MVLELFFIEIALSIAPENVFNRVPMASSF